MPKATKSQISLRAVEILAREVMTEGVEDYRAALERLLRSKPGTAQHESALSALSVAACVLEGKAHAVLEAADEYLEDLPDDD